MEITESNLCVSLWRTNATGLSLDEFYMDILLELPEGHAEFRTIHASAMTPDTNKVSRKVFHIPDISKLVDMSLKDATGYNVLKYLATHKVRMAAGLPKLLFFTGFSNQTIQQTLNTPHNRGQSAALALSVNLLAECTTLINPDSSKKQRLTVELMSDPLILKHWMWEIDLKDHLNQKLNLALSSGRPDQLVPIWA